MSVVVEVDQLVKRYGSLTAVDGVTFSVEAGEIFGILGPNGSGKTTTVECLQGLRDPSGGTLRVLGLDPQRQAGQLRRLIGSQLQASALPERVKVWEALSFFSSLVPGGPPWPDVMEEWGLAAQRSATYASLSGGQRQRLFVALALVNEPSVVFLDEMTTGLDPASRRVAWDLVRRIRDRGATVVLVTHFMDEAEHLCDRVAVFQDKRVAALDTPEGLVETYQNAAEVTFSAPPAADLSFLGQVDGVERVERSGRRVEVTGRGALLARTAAALVANGIVPGDLQVKRSNLEDAFLAITGQER